MVEVGSDLEARRVDQQVDWILHTVDDWPTSSDLINATTGGVDEMDVREVERRQVIVVKADPLAVLAPVRLELGGGLGILDDLVDPSSDRLHHLEVAALELCGLLLGARSTLGVDPHHLGPAVVDKILFGLPAGHGIGEVDDALALPSWREAGEPLGIRRLLVPNADRPRRALEDVELLGDLGDLRDDLHGGRAGADDADPLASKVLHRLGRAPAGEAVVPSARVKGLALIGVDAGDPRQLRLVQDPAGQDQVASGELVTTAGGDSPAKRLLVPRCAGHVGLEERMGVEVEGGGEDLRILEDLAGAGVVL